MGDAAGFFREALADVFGVVQNMAKGLQPGGLHVAVRMGECSAPFSVEHRAGVPKLADRTQRRSVVALAMMRAIKQALRIR